MIVHPLQSVRTLRVYRKYAGYLQRGGKPERLLNILKNKMEASRGRERLGSFPWHITIDPGNICNLSCPGCHTGIKHPEMIRPRFLRYPDFRQYLDDCGRYALSVALYNWGEPFLNKEVFDMIEYAAGKRMGTTVHSNFNHFNQAMAENAVRSGLTHIYASIDGASQNVYEQYRIKGNLSRVLDNIRMLVETRRRLKSRFPIITWKFLVFAHNRHELAAARELAKACGVDDFEVFTGSEHLCDISTFADEARSKPAVLGAMPKRCDSLWSSVYINSDGSVFPCSLAFRESERFGNLKDESFAEIWNNDNYQKARGMFNGNLENIPSPCDRCVHRLKCRLEK